MYNKLRQWDIFCSFHLWNRDSGHGIRNENRLNYSHVSFLGFRIPYSNSSVSLPYFHCSYPSALHFHLFLCLPLQRGPQRGQTTWRCVCNSGHHPEIRWITLLNLLSKYYARWTSHYPAMFGQTCFSRSMHCDMDSSKANVPDLPSWSFIVKIWKHIKWK